MPVPGGEFEAKMLLRSEMPSHGAEQADDQEDRANDHVSAMESGRHEERGTVNVSTEVEVRVRVLVCLHGRESQAQKDREDQTPFQSLPIVFEQSMMCPGHRCA